MSAKKVPDNPWQGHSGKDQYYLSSTDHIVYMPSVQSQISAAVAAAAKIANSNPFQPPKQYRNPVEIRGSDDTFDSHGLLAAQPPRPEIKSNKWTKKRLHKKDKPSPPKIVPSFSKQLDEAIEKVKQGKSFDVPKRLIVVPDRCNCRSCPVCGKRRGYDTRKALSRPEIVAMFKEPVLITLTVATKAFSGPEFAYDCVTNNGYIRRLMRNLGISVWAWFLEFHASGWPHWHVIADVSERGPLTKDDLKYAHSLWGKRWGSGTDEGQQLAGIGGFDVVARKRFQTASHALNYGTKYLTSPDKSVYPEWFLKRSRIRLCQASQKVGRLTLRENAPSNSDPDLIKPRRATRPFLDRMAACGKTLHIVEEELTTEKAPKFRHMGQIRCSIDALAKMQADNLLHPNIKVEKGPLERWGYTGYGTSFTSLKHDAYETLQELKRFLELIGYDQVLNVEIEQTKVKILEENQQRRIIALDRAKDKIESSVKRSRWKKRLKKRA